MDRSEESEPRPDGKAAHRKPTSTAGGRVEPLIPDTTGDERGLVAGRSDEWYERERPPHHG